MRDWIQSLFFLPLAMLKTRVPAFVLGVFLLLNSCYKEKTQFPGGCDVLVSYSSDIKPIINSSCVTHLGPLTGCHDAWIFEHYKIVPFINAGIFQNECFVEKTMPVMPNDFGVDSLTNDEIIMLKCWIDQGFPEN